MDISKLHFHILPGTPDFDDTASDLHNRCYHLWISTWKKIYCSLNDSKGFNQDDFFRNTYITAITYNQEVVALTLVSNFNLNYEACKQHSYMNYYSQEFFNELQKRNLKHVSSLESFTVKEDYQFDKTQVPLAYLIAVLAFKYTEKLNNEGTMISVRSDLKIYEKFARPIGVERIVEDFKSKKFVLDNIFLKKGDLAYKKNPCTNLIESLWQKRDDYTGVTQARTPKEKEEAQAIAA